MKRTQLLVQADDIAISHATTLGILESIEHGIVRNTGLFTNCADAPFAAARLREIPGIDVGIDLNFVTGRPVLDPSAVPGLVDQHGMFRTSGSIRSQYPMAHQDGLYSAFVEEPFDHAQTLAEARAQVERFFALMGRPPAYVHHHSLISTMTDQVLHEIAAEFDLLIVDDLLRFDRIPLLPTPWYGRPFGVAEQARADALAAFEELRAVIRQHELSVLITHPGYVDAELMDASTYSVIRARDLQLVASPDVVATLAEDGVELVTYATATLDGVPVRQL